MSKVIILGAGMAGYGAARKFREENVEVLMFEKNDYYGGHCASYLFDNKWVFDDGPHISFTKSEKVKDIFASNIDNDYVEFQANPCNYWKGKWITHPAQVNLNGLNAEFNTQILTEMIDTYQESNPKIENYEQWLYSTYGKTFSENFPMKYTRKFHTTEASNLTIDWLGPRLYKPKLEEVIYGMLSPAKSDVHYIKEFRYPRHGGYVSFMKGIERTIDIHFKHELSSINLSRNEIGFVNGRKVKYKYLISSLPLNKLILSIEDAPLEIKEAANKLACTQCVLVNFGVNRPNISDNHWIYFYDEDFYTTRLSFPSMFSSDLAPVGCSSIQAEIYFSDKYKPLTKKPEDYIPIIKDELIKCGILGIRDEVLFSNAWLSPYAQVIFDHDRKPAVDLLHEFLIENSIYYGGRFADWSYAWSDESFLRGEHAAKEILRKIK